MKNENLADAVRVLLWGNGDLHQNILDLENALAKHDATPVNTADRNRLTQVVDYLNTPAYAMFSGEVWNKE